MNRESFVRKVVYLGLIVALLLPLSWLSLPATTQAPGGILARKRTEYKIGQASLGQIDPASETLKLSMLGMRSVAALLLWNRADECRMKEDWTGYRATLDQLVSLQPNYIGPWLFQAQNLSFNISHEFDDYRDRYHWVIEGLKFLQRGAAYNENEPRLLWNTGWFACTKIGKADERLQFRRLFQEDDDFHKLQSIRQRDNWLFGREYYLIAERTVDQLGATAPQDPIIFHNWPNIALGYDAEALDEDHLREILAAAKRTGSSRGSNSATTPPDSQPLEDARFAELDRDYQRRIVAAWELSEKAWQTYGERQFTGPGGLAFRLNDRDLVQRQLLEAASELESLAPGVGEKIVTEKRAKLPKEQLAALEILPASRNAEQQALAQLAEDGMRASFHEIAERAPEAQRDKALAVAERATVLQTAFYEILSGRREISLDQWFERCQVERSDDAREARRLAHHAEAYFHVDADLVRARRALERAFECWRRVLDAHPGLKTVHDASLTMVDAVELYRAVLRQLDEPFPQKFILQDLLDAQEYDRAEVEP